MRPLRLMNKVFLFGCVFLLGCSASETTPNPPNDSSVADGGMDVPISDSSSVEVDITPNPDVGDSNVLSDASIEDSGTPDTAADSQDAKTTTDSTDDVFDPVEFCDDDNPCTIDSWDGESCSNEYEHGICCTSNAMCDDDDTCTMDRCVEGLCTHEELCCLADTECSDNDALCTTDVCVDGWCLFQPVSNEACCSAEVFAESFDSGTLTSMSVQNSHPLVGWQVSSQQPAASAPAALWYGNPENNSYDVGVGHSGVARIPTMKLPAGVGLTLSFDVYLDVQSSIAYDLFEVRLIAQGWSQNVLLWSKKNSTGAKQWQSVSVDLTGYAGQSVQIHFIFDSVNETSNDGLGVLLDNIRLESTCESVACTMDSDCNDGLPSTADRCLDGVCASIPNTNYCEESTDCDDGLPCTSNYCTSNVCVYQTLTNCCVVNADCDDGLPCTLDDCVGAYKNKGGFCNHIGIPDCCLNDTACDDSNPCTIDSCAYPGAQCSHDVIENCCSSDLDCNDGDPCTLDQCGNAGCVHVQECCLVDGDCDDGDALCTNDACVDGQCVYDFVNLPGCCSDVVWQESFTGPSMGTFELASDNPSTDGVQWYATSSPVVSAGGALRFAGGWGSYATGSSTAGSARSFAIALPQNSISALQFQLYLDTEYSNGVGNILWDRLQVWVESPPYNADSATLLWDSSWSSTVWWMEEAGVPIGPKWTLVDGLDLSPFQGQSVRIRVDFDSIDGDSNVFGGPTLDDFTILSTCTP